jgi:hypothetical protein
MKTIVAGKRTTCADVISYRGIASEVVLLISKKVLLRVKR